MPTGRSASEPDELSRYGLTPRELDVLRLVAEGRSNGEIAKALFMSPKTASVHVTHILQKLAVSRRVQAAAIAHRLGLGLGRVMTVGLSGYADCRLVGSRPRAAERSARLGHTELDVDLLEMALHRAHGHDESSRNGLAGEAGRGEGGDLPLPHGQLRRRPGDSKQRGGGARAPLDESGNPPGEALGGAAVLATTVAGGGGGGGFGGVEERAERLELFAGASQGVGVAGGQRGGMIGAHRGEVAVDVGRKAQVTAAPSPSTVGEAVMVTAHVSSSNGFPPTGTVTFLDGADELGRSALDENGTATLTTTALAAGARTLTARYRGDALFAPSEGGTTHTVERIATRLEAHPGVARLTPLTVTLRLSATLTDASGTPIAGEPVRFEVGGIGICTAPTDAAGLAMCERSGLALLRTLLHLGYDAIYEGNATYQPSHSHGPIIS